jgi:hypothetical protein
LIVEGYVSGMQKTELIVEGCVPGMQQTEPGFEKSSCFFQ